MFNVEANFRNTLVLMNSTSNTHFNYSNTVVPQRTAPTRSHKLKTQTISINPQTVTTRSQSNKQKGMVHTNGDIGKVVRTGKAGKGTYGVVYIAETLQEKKSVVVKRNIIDSTVDFTGSVKELDLLHKLKQHPHVVELLSVSFGSPFENGIMSPISNSEFKEDHMHFIFEKAKCDYHTLIYNTTISYDVIKMSMVHLLLGVEYMHSKGLIHRDLKPSNLLWFENTFTGKFPTCNGHVKICDFGLSEPYTYQGTQTSKVVTSWYRAPEICLLWPDYNLKIDTWSIGCIFFEMLAKKAFLQSTPDRDNQLVNKILSLMPRKVHTDTINKMFKYKRVPITDPSSRRSFEQQLGLSPHQIQNFNRYGSYTDFLDLLSHLLVFDPDERYTCTDALNHPFFKDYRHYIDEIRKKYPPIPDTNIHITIYTRPERLWVIETVFNIYNGRQLLPWYSHRILFQALDLYDRYLEYRIMTQSVNSITESKYETLLKFMVCLYISIKYFITLSVISSFTELVTEEYNTEEAMRTAEDFELVLIRDILKYNIYRPTIYETADVFNEKLTESRVRDLLQFYGTLNCDVQTDLHSLYRQFTSIHGDLSMTNPIYSVSYMPVYIKPKETKYVLGKGFKNQRCKLKIVDRVDYNQTK